MRNHRSKVVLLLALALVFAACTSWEQQTYQTLAATKAVIDQAAVDYNAGVLPQTRTVHDLIEKARLAQKTAVDAFSAYAVVKVAKEPQATIEEKQQAVLNAVAAVSQVIVDIKAIKGGK